MVRRSSTVRPASCWCTVWVVCPALKPYRRHHTCRASSAAYLRMAAFTCAEVLASTSAAILQSAYQELSRFSILFGNILTHVSSHLFRP